MVSEISISHLRMGAGRKPPIGCVYGASGVGKTTFACSWPSPIALQSEDGLTSPDLQHIPTLGVMNSYEDVLQGLKVIYLNAHDHGWKTLVVDTLSKLEPMIEDYVSRKHFGGQRLGEVAYGKGWPALVDEVRTFVTAVSAFRNDLGMNVLLVDHSRVITMNPPDGDAFKRHSLAVSDRATPVIIRDLDFLLYAAVPITTIAKGEARFGKQETRAMADRPRLYCTPAGGYEAKNRYNMPPFVLLERGSMGDVPKYIPTIAGLVPQTNSTAVAAE